MYNYITHSQKKKQKYNMFHVISKYSMEVNVDEENPQNEFFYNKEGKVRMENLHQNEEFWVDYDDIWSKVGDDFDDNYLYTKKLIQSMVGTVFKIRPFPAQFVAGFLQIGWKRYSRYADSK